MRGSAYRLAPSKSASPKGERADRPMHERAHDRLLVEAARRGDALAFRQLVDRYRPRAFAVALQMLRDEHEAEEIVQEAFLRAHRSLSDFHGRSSFFTWLYRIVRNLALDILRKPSRFVDIDSEHLPLPMDDLESLFVSRIDGAEPIDYIFRRQAAVHLRRALEALPPYHRDVMVMCAIDELSCDEMAQAMNVSRGTIMSRLFHARRKLRHALGNAYSPA